MRELIQRHPALRPLAVAAFVTALVTLAAAVVPRAHAGTAVGVVFLGAVHALVWRHDDARVETLGVSLGGLVASGRLDFARLAREASRAVGWAALAAAVSFLPFYFGWRFVWHPPRAFAWSLDAKDALNLALGQLMLVALPEEAFFRGYLQSTLDLAWPPRLRVLGARVGPGLLVASAIFAVGHLLTVHHASRLAVFFPSLAFGWLRARSGGIGASIAFHAACNVLSEILGKGYGLY